MGETEAGMDSFRILRMWAAAAWADGVLHPAEKAALERLIEASEDLGGEAREQARSYLSAAPKVSINEIRALPAAAREGIYRAARGIVVLDGELHADEAAFLDKLRGALNLDAAVIERIESESR